jgi:hypothetical protein
MEYENPKEAHFAIEFKTKINEYCDEFLYIKRIKLTITFLE